MKTLISLAIITVLFSSCIKKYSCKCTTTLSQTGYRPYETVTIEELPKHSSKKKATQICSNTAKQVQANASEAYPDFITVGTACEVKDY